MKHSHLNKRKAFELIADALERGEQPTDQAIMECCGFWQLQPVKSLLADLADERAITVSWSGAVRTIALGPRERVAAVPASRPVPPVRHGRPSEPSIDQAAAKIIAIARGEKNIRGASGTAREASSVEGSPSAMRNTVRAPAPEPEASAPPAPTPMPKRPEVETVEAQREDTATRSPSPAGSPQSITFRGSPHASVDQGRRPARPAAQGPRESHTFAGTQRAEGAAKRDAEPPRAVEARHPCRSFMASEGSRTKRMAVYLTPADYDLIDAEADRTDAPTGRLASDAIAEFADALRCGTGGKHRIKAAVLRAWRQDGRPLDQFVTALIDTGLEEYLRFRSQAEAA